jgi:hypothetical protein
VVPFWQWHQWCILNVEVICLALKPGLVFDVMASAYRNDVLDKSLSIMGEAIDGAMQDSGLGIGDLVNKMDEAQERTVMKLNNLLARSGPLLRLAASDRLMAAVSRLLDVKLVRKTGARVMRRMLVKAVTATTVAAGGRETACDERALEGGRP